MPPSERLVRPVRCLRPGAAEIDELEAEDSMKSVKFGTMGLLVACAASTATGAAFAQEAAVGAGATATTTTTTTVAPAPAPATAPPAPAQTGMTLPGAAPDAAAAGGRDHDLVVGHFGIGYMGRRSIVINPALDGAGNPGTVDAPIIGMRYWLDPMLGIDAGLGLLFSSGSVKTDPGGMSNDLQGYTVVMLHGGVPLALAGSRHFSFQIVPELNLGIASSTAAGAGPGGADIDYSGFHLDVGARAGTEIQFGFIGIPELSLQAGVGLALSYDRVKATAKTNPEGSQTVSQTRIGTSVGDNPWNIFTGNVAALYYFD
jgi:hypothetical protein